MRRYPMFYAAARPATPSDMPMLPQHLINLIGEYGMARADSLSDCQRVHIWTTLIAAIKNYAWAAQQVPCAMVVCSAGSANN
jgi:hypothetical protein